MSIGCHRDKSIVWPAAVQGLESSRFLVRLTPLPRTSAGAHQVDSKTCHEKMCKMVDLHDNLKSVSESVRLSFGKISQFNIFPGRTFNCGSLKDPSFL